MRLLGVGLVGVVLLVGCKADRAGKTSGVAGETAGRAVAPSKYQGTISGTVSFAAAAPKRVEIDTSMDPACSFGAGKVLSEQVVVNQGKLQNVFLYVKTGPDAAMTMGPVTEQPVVMDQRGCQYVPHVVGVMQGQRVEFRNSDSTMHNIHTMPVMVGNETVDVSQGPKGAPVLKQMVKPELMMPVRCNNHPWMNAFINVAATPFFAVSDAAGNFAIHGLPPGTYTLGAVQEKLGEKTVTVTVPADGTGTASVSFGQ